MRKEGQPRRSPPPSDSELVLRTSGRAGRAGEAPVPTDAAAGNPHLLSWALLSPDWSCCSQHSLCPLKGCPERSKAGWEVALRPRKGNIFLFNLNWAGQGVV